MNASITYSEIQERLIQRTMQPYPENLPVVAGSTPVVSFGNPIKTVAVTLGINPSYEEFQDGDKKILALGKKRLVDHEILNGDFRSGLSREQAETVIHGCHYYFDRNPYDWFTEIERVALSPFNLSYRNGSAAHLDIIQWATDPVWSKIPNQNDCQTLLDADAEFLRFQLRAYPFTYVLMNGKTVIEQVQSLNLLNLKEVGTISFGNGDLRSKVWRGEFDRKIFLGWNLNIQRHETTERNKQDLTNWLKSQID